jgi:hypothetical protein
LIQKLQIVAKLAKGGVKMFWSNPCLLHGFIVAEYGKVGQTVG